MQFQNHDKERFWDALGEEGLVVSGSWGSRGCGCLRGGGVSCRIGIYCKFIRISFCNTMHAMQLAALIGKVLEIDNAITSISDAF